MSIQIPPSAVIFCPAKVNLFLAITGIREDGFHNLLSVVAPLDFGDHLWVEPGEPGEPDHLECQNPELETGPSNLVLRASSAFRKHRELPFGLRYRLIKRIPLGSGLGGGSSNAASVLRLLNSMVDDPLSMNELKEIAAELGSDVPLFLINQPAIMRGRGEQIEPLPQSAANRLSGRRILLFKPEFSIETAWAYGCLAANPLQYASPAHCEEKLNQWLHSTQTIEQLLFNSFEAPIFQKFLTYPTLFEILKKNDETSLLLSGSGSACFALVMEKNVPVPLITTIREAWGEEVFIVESTIL